MICTHVVCKWIGNYEPVAAKHYLQLTDEHFEQASSETKAAHFEAHSGQIGGRKGKKAPTTVQKVQLDNDCIKSALSNDLPPVTDSYCKPLSKEELRQVPPEGLEPSTR